MVAILEKTLQEGFEVLVLTNAYKAIKKSYESLVSLQRQFGTKLKIRVSLDHYLKDRHESERGKGTFQETLNAIKWLVDNNIHTSIAGRSLMKEPMDLSLKGYQDLLDFQGIDLKLELGQNIVIFPEMDQKQDVPEISERCWSLLNKKPSDQMCSSERMIVKKKIIRA